MNDAVIVEVGDGGECGTDKVGSIGFVVAALTAYPVEQFAAESKVGDKIDWGEARLVCLSQGCRGKCTVVHGLEVVD